MSRNLSNLGGYHDQYKHRVESALQQASLRIERSVSLADGHKHPQAGETGHTDPANQRRPTNISGNCSLHTGDGLAAIDLDDQQAFPAEIKSMLPDTFAIRTPHDGKHLLYHVPDDTGITNAKLPNSSGDFQYDGKYVVCPGSYVDHSDCDSSKANCPGNGADFYQPANDLAIATLSQSEHPELLEWLRNLGSDYRSASSSSSASTSDAQQELDPLDQGQAEEQYHWFYRFLRDEAGNEARKTLHSVLKGGRGDIIDLSDDGTIDRNKADLYALKRIYGAFIYRGDSKSEARKNTRLVFRHFIQEQPEHSDLQQRKLLTHNQPEKYLEYMMDSVESEFDQGDWYEWFNWQSSDSSKNFAHLNKSSRLTKATVLAAIEYLTSFDSESAVSIEYLQHNYQAHFEQIEPDQLACELPSLPQHTTMSSSMNPHGPNAHSSNQVHVIDSEGELSEIASDRTYPTRREIQVIARLLNPVPSEEHFQNTLSEMVNDLDPLVTVVQAKCPSRSNGERYVYYLDRESDGERDPADAECVKLHGRELEPTTRDPYDDDTDSVQEMSI